MIWVGIGIGVSIGSLLILAFWLGQRSVARSQVEQRNVVSSPESMLVADQADQVPAALEKTQAQEAPSHSEPDDPPNKSMFVESGSEQPEADGPFPDATELRKQIAGLLRENEPQEQSTDPRTRRRWVGSDTTLCGAINSVRSTFPSGTRGTFDYKGSPAEGWRTQFALRDDEVNAVPRRSHDLKAPTYLSLEELPDLLAADEWTKVFNQVAAGDAILETPVWPGLHKQRRPVRWMSVTDPTFCGAVNGIRDSRPYGSSVTLEWNLTSKREWWVWDTNYGSQERAGDRAYDNEEWFKRKEEGKANSGERHEADSFKPPSYRERRSHSSGKTPHCKWDIYVGSFAPTTANNSRGGLDKFGCNPDTEHLGTWRDDL